MKNCRFIALALLVALVACTVGPDYQPPKTGMPDRYSDDSGPTVPVSDTELAEWWKLFNDPVLDHLIELALAQNINIKIASSRIREARLQEVIARSSGLPQVSASAGINNTQFSKNAGLSSLQDLFTGGSGNSGIAAPGNGITTYAAGFDASWEIDLFGGNRRLVEATTASGNAIAWSARDASISLIAEVADDYLKLRALQTDAAVLQEQLASQQSLLRLLKAEVNSGLEAGASLFQQGSQVEITRAVLIRAQGQQLVLINTIALLLAMPIEELPAELSRESQLNFEVPPTVPAGLPSDLLRRRPDIRAAEQRLAASTAEIGVATASLYPRFSLTGAAELISTALTNLVSANSLQTMAGVNAAFPVLDFGRNRALVGIAREQAEQTYLEYQFTVLAALSDVNTALAELETERERGAALARAVEDAQRGEQAATAQYKAGLTDFSMVYQNQLTLLAALELSLASDALLRENLVSLYKALGGGWQVSELISAE